MNRLCASLSLGLVLATSVAMAGQVTRPSLGGPTLISQGVPDLPMPAPLSPVPEIQYSGPVGQLPVVTMAPEMTLFPNVRYRATRNMSPCAVPIVVQVPDPCTPRNSCCPRPCVNVEICVPSCGCPQVCVTRRGNKTTYDYGKYAVNVISLNGRIVVDYDD